ncbi:MAG TPA: glycosyltransferase WbuB [bacterium]|nr:glycosyltransferase WbuB [bacterium]
MKICMVGYTVYEKDGRLHRYATSLAERGDTVHVIGSGEADSPARSEVGGVRVYQLSSRDFSETTPATYLRNMIRFFYSSSLLLTRLHHKEKYDIIHYHNIPDFGVFCAWYPKLTGAKVILDIHDLVPEFYMRKFGVGEGEPIIRLLKWVEKISCRFADHVITVTDIWRKRLAMRAVPSRKTSVIMNLPMDAVFRKVPFRLHHPGEPFIIRYHGNVAEQTGVDIAVHALHLLRDQIPDLRFRIIGEGRDSDKIQALIRKYRLHDRVSLHPSVPVMELARHLKDAHLAVDPKRSGVYAGETLSVKSMEYLRLGIPLIASRTVAADHYFDERFVRFFDPENPESLADAIRDLYADPAKRRNLSDNAALFFERHDWEKTRVTYHRILAGLTGRSVNSQDSPAC